MWFRPPKRAAYVGEAGAGQLARQVHGHLAGPDDRGPAVAAQELPAIDPDLVGRGRDDVVEADLAAGAWGRCRRAGGERTRRSAPRRAPRRGPPPGSGCPRALGRRWSTCSAISSRTSGATSTPSSRARFSRITRRTSGSGDLQLDHQARAEALGEAVLEADELVGRPVGGQHELAAGVLQGVEGVEELLAGALLAREELDVVDEHHVGAAEALLEVTGAAVAHRLDEVGR